METGWKNLEATGLGGGGVQLLGRGDEDGADDPTRQAGNRYNSSWQVMGWEQVAQKLTRR